LLVQECESLHGCETGESKITDGYNLPARKVIHTVGPVWRGGGNNEPELLSNCYRSALNLAIKHRCRSIAFPAISTGVYGYPPREAAEIAVNTVREVLAQNPDGISVVFCCFSENDLNLYTELLHSLS
jgi:O-acetyl-ADP-ribose deacetylase (regulator of RNase III)